MPPYLQAHNAYIRANTAGEMPPWSHILDFHLQHGHLISTPQLFILARPVSLARLEIHPELILDLDPDPHTYHIMAAAGNLKHLLSYALANNVQHITYQRRLTETLHHLNLSSLKTSH